MGDIRGLDQAQRRALSVCTPRYLRLDKLERYVEGTQYEGRDDFLYPKGETPLLERAPNIVYPIVRAAIRQHVDFALGDGKFPRLSTRVDDCEDIVKLSKSQQRTVDAYLLSIVESTRMQDAAQDALEAAESCGTAVAVLCARDGFLEFDILKAKWCTPTYAANGRDIESLEVCYPFVDIRVESDGTYAADAKMFRRVIDAERDTVFRPATIKDDGRRPSFSEDGAQSVAHGLGFCPVIWYAFRKTCSRVDNPDGDALHAELTDEIDALNFALSMRGRAALYSGDPQMYEVGVDDGAQVGPSGHAPQTPPGELKGFWSGGMSSRKREARQKGAGVVWRYGNPDAKVGMLTLPGDALVSLDKHALDLEEKIGNVLGHTRIHPEEVKGALSGKALAFMYARTTSVVDRIRREFWDGFIQPALSMLLRMTLKLIDDRRNTTLYVPGAEKAAKALRKFDMDGRWICPRIRPQWGPYFELTPTEEYDAVRMVTESIKVLPREIAIEPLRKIFHFDSVQEVLAMGEPEGSKDEAPPKSEPEPKQAEDEEDSADEQEDDS